MRRSHPDCRAIAAIATVSSCASSSSSVGHPRRACGRASILPCLVARGGAIIGSSREHCLADDLGGKRSRWTVYRGRAQSFSMREIDADAVYEAAFAPEKWKSAIERVGRAVGAISGAIAMGDEPSRWVATDNAEEAMARIAAEGGLRRGRYRRSFSTSPVRRVSIPTTRIFPPPSSSRSRCFATMSYLLAVCGAFQRVSFCPLATASSPVGGAPLIGRSGGDELRVSRRPTPHLGRATFDRRSPTVRRGSRRRGNAGCAWSARVRGRRPWTHRRGELACRSHRAANRLWRAQSFRVSRPGGGRAAPCGSSDDRP